MQMQYFFRPSIIRETISKLITKLPQQFFDSSSIIRRRCLSNYKTHHSDEKSDVNGSCRLPTPKLFVVQPRLRPDALLKAKLDEALNLAKSLEEQRESGIWSSHLDDKETPPPPPPHLVVQNPLVRVVKSRAETYFGQGTVDTVKCHLNSEEEVDAVFVNTILSGIQQRNLERIWEKPVLDRVGLIIEIFNAHAQTKEAKLQSELAALMYKRTRLIRVVGPDGRLTFGSFGEAEVVSARGRGGSGGRGFMSGAGETELQLQRRRILERRNHLLSQIEEVRRTRAVQRAGRKRHGGFHGQGLPTIAIVGYTNAGKSTLVSALSKGLLYSDDRLFATVDPHLRSVILPSGRKVILSDTVGFISDLPVQLIEAFHATLEEVVEADLLVHVLDSSAFNVEEQRTAVLQVLHQIGVSEEKLKNMIEVWNKVDLIRDTANTLDSNQSIEDEECDEEEDVQDEESELSTEHLDKDEESWAIREDEENLGEDIPCRSLNITSQVLPNTRDLELPKTQHVETSAVMGIGFQELLKVIDKKLNIQPSDVESLDRKWRPTETVNEDAIC